ncbi:MAG: DNA methyltransferase, partial [Chitinophagaceae bacterium]|nr:DNA methyltransferase [Chitinophagaceae bacterium]
MTIQQYVEKINQRYNEGNATEHTYRGDLQLLLESLLPDIQVTNESKRRDCGAPDYILSKKSIEVGYIEVKDIGDIDLEGKKKNKEQFDRYKKGLDNVVFSDYMHFYFYRESALVATISIAELKEGKIVALPENFATFSNLIKDFCSYVGQTIKSSRKLAEMMAGKARLLSDIIEKALTSDEEKQEDSTLKDQMNAFKQILIYDITPKGFADVYAQTIAYGMFAARLHDATLPTFSRQEAAELIPKSNPFLRKLFGYIAGPDIDDRIKWVVDGLVTIFLACNVKELLKDYGKATKMEDPIIHFYETFLSEYDPKLRKARGVWYTPAPVVSFIVRAVDDILKTEFGLPQGLADTSKTKIKTIQQSKATSDARSKIKDVEVEEEVHRVQILDPATGTGTFLAEVVKHIHKKFEGQQGIWSNYVATHLLPRLNGFELLMASYAMAHLQLDLLLTETGYKANTDQRLRVYLTNSLEKHHPDTDTLWGNIIADEANAANRIKRDTPVMCVIGNPPYSGESQNKGKWIMDLMEDYKMEPGGIIKLKERNPKWVNADENKFIRYGQYFIEKNGSGVLAFINPHSFLDNPTFRGMRWHLLKTFDKIYTIDLHGNSKKKETTPDGGADVNVFDIQQGVSINIFVKTGKKKANELGKVFHFDLYGKREMKYDFLLENSLKSINFKELPNIPPNYFFVNKDFEEQKEYDKGFSVCELFTINNVGIVTSKDAILINENKEKLLKSVNEFYTIVANKELIQRISYRPFDDKYIYYDTKIIERAREKIMQHFLIGETIGLVIARQCAGDWQYAFITKLIGEFNLTGTAGRYGSGNYFPLYLYPENKAKESSKQLRTDAAQAPPRPSDTPPEEGNGERVPNLDMKIVDKICKDLGLYFSPEGPNEVGATEETMQLYPIYIIDYIYAVLHSPSYRERYKEFLKIDFPRVPYPKSVRKFYDLVELGSELRQ